MAWRFVFNLLINVFRRDFHYFRPKIDDFLYQIVLCCFILCTHYKFPFLKWYIFIQKIQNAYLFRWCIFPCTKFPYQRYNLFIFPRRLPKRLSSTNLQRFHNELRWQLQLSTIIIPNHDLWLSLIRKISAGQMIALNPLYPILFYSLREFIDLILYYLLGIFELFILFRLIFYLGHMLSLPNLILSNR